jgi:hypothetical protein
VFRFRLRALFLVTVAVAALLTFVVKPFQEWNRQLTSEYATADVIRDVTKYVKKHKGEWPEGWSDIPNGDDARHYVDMKFDVRIAELINDPELMYTVIVPESGVYYTYPDAELRLDYLRETLCQFHPRSSR